MEEPPNKDSKDCEKLEDSRRSTVGAHEVDCDELEESMKSIRAYQLRTMACGTNRKNHITSSKNVMNASLPQEKQRVAYPIARQKHKSIKETSPHALLPDGVVGSHALFHGGPSLRGIGRNQGRLLSHHRHVTKKSLEAHPTGITVDTRIPTMRGLQKNDGPNATTDDEVIDPGTIPTLRGLRKNDQPNQNDKTTKPATNPSPNLLASPEGFSPVRSDIDIVVKPLMDTMEDNNENNTDIVDASPSYISYLDDNTNRPYISYLDDDSNNKDVANAEKQIVVEDQLVENEIQRKEDVLIMEQGRAADDLQGSVTPTATSGVARGEQQSLALDPSVAVTLPSLDNSSLVEALPVEEENCDSDMMEAKPIDREQLVQLAARAVKDKKYKQLACCFVVVACLVLTLTLAFGLSKSSNDPNFSGTNVVPTESLTKPLPPMENLELLYDELPENTKERLYERNSPQYQAWEWLLNHPKIIAYPTWRKKQIFALSTLFYSFQGPNWPETTPARDRWMNANTSECSWIMAPREAAYWHAEFTQLIGTGAYEAQDWQPCNKHGKIQLLALNQIFLLSNLEPTIPPEIGFLTSLRLLGFAFGDINIKLSELLVPELLQLSRLEGFTLSNNGVRGTIPKKLFFYWFEAPPD